MDQLTKYRILQGLVVISFLYLLSTEVQRRWSDALGLWGEIRSQETTPLTFEQYAEKKADLIARKRQLLAEMNKRSDKFEQSPTGVFELLTTTAKKAAIRIEGLIPKEIKEEGEFKVVGFKVAFTSTYHQAGNYLNQLETGSFPISIDAVSFSSEPAGNTKLAVSIEGRAYVLSKE